MKETIYNKVTKGLETTDTKQSTLEADGTRRTGGESELGVFRIGILFVYSEGLV